MFRQLFGVHGRGSGVHGKDSGVYGRGSGVYGRKNHGSPLFKGILKTGRS